MGTESTSGPPSVNSKFAELFPRTSAELLRGLSEGVFPGFAVGIWTADPQSAAFIPQFDFGGVKRTDLPTQSRVDTSTSFDLASLTKNLSTSLLALRLVDARILDLETEVRSVLPTSTSWSGIRVRHLLAHTSGLPAWAPLYDRVRSKFGGTGDRLANGEELLQTSLEQRLVYVRDLVLNTAPDRRPDQVAVYSDLGFIALGLLIEEITGIPLEEAASRWVYEPLSLDSFEYRTVVLPPQATIETEFEKYAATETCAWRGGTLQGQVHDDNTWCIGGVAGHAGVFGRIEDVLGVAQKLATTHAGFLSRSSLNALWSRVRVPNGCERTLGWDTPSPTGSSVGSRFSTHTVGHLGFTGTSLWLDLDAGVAVGLLTNRVHPTRANEAIRLFRPKFHDAVRSDLGY